MTAGQTSPIEESATTCGTYSGTGCAPTSSRVDIAEPTFSNSTKITNPLFPISNLKSVVLLGQVDGKPFRSETTLLPRTATVTWRGRPIEVALSQYMAFSDGRLEEIALDRYAQADDGSVWYFGEDVFDYRRGAIAVTEGTWLAGRSGPAAMILPGAPKVGDTFRPENVTGVVFEEVTVTSTDATVDGPRGPIPGALVGRELHLDGSYSDKTFAPGYGEFRTGKGEDVEALALAVPADASDAPLPKALREVSVGAFGLLENARLGDWEAATSTIAYTRASWQALAAEPQPPLIARTLTGAMNRLAAAIKAKQGPKAEQAAIDVARLALDLELRYRAPVEVDIDRFHLWAQQLSVHAAAKDAAGVAGDVATMEWVRDRVVGVLDAAGRNQLDAGLRDLRIASDAGNLAAAADHAARLGAELRNVATHSG